MDLVSKHVDLAKANSDFGSGNMDINNQTCSFNIQEMIYKDISNVHNDSADGLLAIEVGNIAGKKRCCPNASKNATKYSRIKRGLD